MESITSRQNEMVKRHARLLRSAAERRAQGLFLCEGARLCSDAAASGAAIAVCYVTEAAFGKYRRYCGEILRKAERSFWISEPVAQLLSDTRNPQGVFCVCRLPAERPAEELGAPAGCCLALEALQDPGNLGTALRTAEALGVDAVLLAGGCDPYGPKVLRGSMGAVFRLPLFICEEMAPAVRRCRAQGMQALAAVVDPAAVPVTAVDFSRPTVLVVGNEGSGLSAETVAACGCRITIPMAGRAESLNASAASSILLWEMMRGRGGKEGQRHG